MTDNRLLAVCLRSLAGLVALAGLLALGACGGGSGAPNNPFNSPGNLTITPSVGVVVYSGTTTTLTVTGGTPPYKAFSSNAAVISVDQNVSGNTIPITAARVSADTPVTITVSDSGAPATQFAVSLTARGAPLLNSLTITPNATECGTTAICSGQDGTAAVTVLGAGGATFAGRQVRFDVVAGPYSITTTNPAQPLASTLVVFSDQNGVASVILRANTNAPTQFAQLKATDLTSGQQLTGNFLIQQITDGSKILTVVPSDATITAFFKGECSSGFATNYYIYGGTPPYRVASSFPTAVTILNSTVNASGGFFTTVTNGTCFDPNTYTIVDATGRQTTTLGRNKEGTNDHTVVPPLALDRIPGTYDDPACTGKTFSFSVFGGTPPYNVTTTSGVATPQTINTAGGTTAISGLLTGSGVTSVVFIDAGTPHQSVTATITCNNPNVTSPPDLLATPSTYPGAACTAVTPFTFVVTGGTPPYSVTATRGISTPPVVANSGGKTTVTGLVAGSGDTSVVFLDQSSPQKRFTSTITCIGTSAAPPLFVSGSFTYTVGTCSAQFSNFAITGGTPPYHIFFAAPVPPSGTITPTTVQQSGQGFSVTSLPDVSQITYVTVSDSGDFGVTQQQAIRSITCSPP